jgi:CarD family transcriptional regulator
LNVFVIHFEKDRMTLRVPVGKAKGSGLRRLSTRKEMDAALAKLKGRSKARRTMWSRRAQEYEAKINSGDPASIAEVVRDLYRNVGQPEQSYSERQIYQAALDRLVRELAAVESIDETAATQKLEQLLKAA